MTPWICECSCVCGLCPGGDCECECHLLDSLTNAQLMQIMVSKGGFFVAHVVNKSRNMLFKIMTEHKHPEKLLEEGVNMVDECMRTPTFTPTPLSVLRSIAKGTSRTSPTTTSPVPKSSKNKVPTVARKRPVPEKKAARTKKPAPKKKIRAQKAKARRLDNCKT